MLKQLERYEFTGYHASYIGALKSCADYYSMDISPAWLFGMTGQAFMMVTDEHLISPNVGLPEEEQFTLAANIGLRIQGRHSIQTDEAFKKQQQEVWEQARTALNQNKPVFAKEIGLGNIQSHGMAELGTRGRIKRSAGIR
ncbi:hypothetical protein J2T15_002860 [Paenibacillus harenae]|uniref:Uncharacterized protein n=1 Tax=Paenibacillus harenae TaxID=306543 RepID=A0ABT9U1B3_PAEHA|nr:hypothetical protein [Paenibacillus harenae]